jgi:hypothetical protein
MRRYHVRVTLLTLGVLLGFGSAIARYGFGYRFGHDCYHHHHHHHDHCDHDHNAARKDEPVEGAAK